MATQKPLILTSTGLSQLPIGDTIGGLPPAVAPGQPLVFEQLGGSVLTEQATLLLPAQVRGLEQVVTRPGTLPTQSARAWLADSIDNDVWQLEGVTINAVCGVDEIFFYLSCQYFESGNINIRYQVF